MIMETGIDYPNSVSTCSQLRNLIAKPKWPSKMTVYKIIFTQNNRANPPFRVLYIAKGGSDYMVASYSYIRELESWSCSSFCAHSKILQELARSLFGIDCIVKTYKW
jgi:hypothetical protein